MIGAGVPAGNAMPYQPTTSISMPCSAIVGSSGDDGQRLGVVRPSTFRSPDLTRPVTAASVSATKSSSLARSAAITAGELRYGMCLISMPARRRNSSAAKCCVEPMPMVPKLSLPGLALAAATTSLMLLNGESLCVTIT